MVNSQLENRKLILDKYIENSGMSQCQIAKSLKILRSTVQNVLSNLFKTKSIERQAGSGRKAGAGDKNIEIKYLRHFRRIQICLFAQLPIKLVHRYQLSTELNAGIL